ncbi:unnamed protein product, partial [Closterium sp. NIES-54]
QLTRGSSQEVRREVRFLNNRDSSPHALPFRAIVDSTSLWSLHCPPSFTCSPSPSTSCSLSLSIPPTPLPRWTPCGAVEASAHEMRRVLRPCLSTPLPLKPTPPPSPSARWTRCSAVEGSSQRTARGAALRAACFGTF